VNICIRLMFAVTLCLLCAVNVLGGDKGVLDQSLIDQFEKSLTQVSDVNRIVNAVTNNDIASLSLNRSLVATHNSQFNVKVEGGKVINQQNSGRCWMFAGANVVTPKVISKLKLPDFKLSEAYLSFWDKLEKANNFLEMMITLRDKPIDDRSLEIYIKDPVGDGGWWTDFENLIRKYGLAPASAMPETKQSSSTGKMNELLNSLMRKSAAEIRRIAREGKGEGDLRKYKEVVMGDVYRLLVYNYGKPPKEFTFRWEEGEDSAKTLTERIYTPMSFFTEFYTDMPQFVVVVDNPTLQYNKTYQLENCRSMAERPEMIVLNLPIEKLKQYTFKSIVDSQVVWFVCDVGKDNFNDSGIFAVDIYDYNQTFGINFTYSKADRIAYKDLTTNHAMLLTGVDTTADGKPRKWLVENSWGTDRGKEGFWTMYDAWFDQYVLMVIVDKTRLEPGDAARFDEKPTLLRDWEPFFASFRNLR
jgi:bleomycin hydrolase